MIIKKDNYLIFKNALFFGLLLLATAGILKAVEELNEDHEIALEKDEYNKCKSQCRHLPRYHQSRCDKYSDSYEYCLYRCEMHYLQRRKCIAVKYSTSPEAHKIYDEQCKKCETNMFE